MTIQVAGSLTEIHPLSSAVLSHQSSLLLSALPQAWREMERLVGAGLVRSVGVSNFREADITHLISLARIKPVVNQARGRSHPFCMVVG